jgi:hypothetical protein
MSKTLGDRKRIRSAAVSVHATDLLLVAPAKAGAHGRPSDHARSSMVDDVAGFRLSPE